jgi:thymidylate kinase
MSLVWLENKFEQMGEVNENVIQTFPDFVNGLLDLSITVAKGRNQRWSRAGKESRDAKGTDAEQEKTKALWEAIYEAKASQNLAIRVKQIVEEYQQQMANLDNFVEGNDGEN